MLELVPFIFLNKIIKCLNACFFFFKFFSKEENYKTQTGTRDVQNFQLFLKINFYTLYNYKKITQFIKNEMESDTAECRT